MESMQPELDPDAKTEPVLERLIEIMADVRSRVISIEKHQDTQDRLGSDLRGGINLVGGIATNALEVAEKNESHLKQLKDTVASLEQSVAGMIQLTKSTFDIVTEIKAEVCPTRLAVAVSD
jgi:hypothetical protein